MKDEIKEIDESPYCDVCGTCGYIGCCGIRNFIEEHIKGKTNCKNEDLIISELIDLCEYKDEIFKENERLNNIINEIILECYNCDMTFGEFKNIWKKAYNKEYNSKDLDKLKELKEGK